MMVPFAKLHACGNDFLVVEHEAGQPPEALRRLAIALCNRHSGVGADGVEFLQMDEGGQPSIRLYNADGSVAEISGNGTRCVAGYLAHTQGLSAGASVTIATDAGPRTCRLIAEPQPRAWQVAQNMGVPTVRAARVELPGAGVSGAVVNTGNPHFVVFCQDPTFQPLGLDWRTLGEQICCHPDFAPGQTNVEFVHIRSAAQIEIRLWERGVGPTSSSGTGTCAASAAAMELRGCQRALTVVAPGGAQTTQWLAGEQMMLTGPAVWVASGEAFVDAKARS